MKMPKIFVVLATLAVALSAHALGFPKVPSAGGGGATPADVDKFLADATVADALVNDASEALFKAVAAKEDVQKYNDAIAAAKQIADPKEKQAAIDKANAEIRDPALRNAKYAEQAEKLKTDADQKKKQNAASGIYNLALGALKDTELVAAGKKLVSGPPNPAIASKLPSVKDSIERLGGQAQNLPKVVDSAKKLMSSVGLEALPTSASDAPKPITKE